MTRIAALEASTRLGSVALLLDGEVHQRDLARESAHASDLLPALDALLAEAGCALASLDAIAVGLGPGSFTGLRVAAATALGLSRGADLALIGVASFAAAALDALAPGETGAVLGDARSGAVYVARYARGDALAEIAAPAAITADQALARLDPSDAVCADEEALRALAGDRADVLAALRSRARAAQPRAGAVARLGAVELARGGSTPPSALEPLYLRPFLARTRAR